MDQFFSWGSLSTVAGAAVVVWVVIEALKSAIGPVFSGQAKNITTLVLSVALMVVFTLLNGTHIWGDYILAVLNGCVVSLATLRFSDTTIPTLQAKREIKRLEKENFRND